MITGPAEPCPYSRRTIRCNMQNPQRLQQPNAMCQNISIPRKRKPSDDEGSSSGSQADSPKVPRGEYETGRVVCEVCGEGISFRDNTTGGFTLRHWSTHRQECVSPSHGPPDAIIHTPESTADAIANPPVKRRRTKRNEAERIEYLREDPYVAKFEAYRVLCGSCDKWIRLRPNSTYCSIPWDAHRKSCLSKRVTKQDISALEERNAILSQDPDVHKFDAERILCHICGRWLHVHSSNHTEALRQWTNHRTACKNVLTFSRSSRDQFPIHPPITVLPLSEEHPALATRPPFIPGPLSISSVRPTNDTTTPNASSSSFKEVLNLDDFPASQEIRRRSAEQRAAVLRSDPLLREVEHNRVLCKICQKWVQLRQDSSYCAYPWQQHRSKCLTRNQKVAERTAKLAERKTQRASMQEQDQLLTDDDAEWTEDDFAAENGIDQHASVSQYRIGRQKFDRQAEEATRDSGKGMERASGRLPTPVDHLAPRFSTGLADLDSPPGRIHFIFASIVYLFATTYEPSDDMTISALLSYVNAAMPPDKHEDFDTAEIIRAAAALQYRGEITFEGDVLRLLH